LSGFSFKKEERITSRSTLSSLFTEGKIVHVPPLRILYLPASTGKYPAAVAVSVPRRLFRKAVDRNLLKRRIREAYRSGKPFFYSGLNKLGRQANLVILYQHHEKVDYHTIHEALLKGLEKILREIA
jgi:ribonuclease P protein component